MAADMGKNMGKINANYGQIYGHIRRAGQNARPPGQGAAADMAKNMRQNMQKNIGMIIAISGGCNDMAMSKYGMGILCPYFIFSGTTSRTSFGALLGAIWAYHAHMQKLIWAKYGGGEYFTFLPKLNPFWNNILLVLKRLPNKYTSPTPGRMDTIYANIHKYI